MRSPSQSTNHPEDSRPEIIGADEEDSQPPPELTMGAGEEESQPVPLPNLPPEITVEILSRLPVKSLLRLRCVCKSWRSLISGREFAKTHLGLASSIDTDYAHHRLLITSPFAFVMSCSLYSILDELSDTDVVELDYPLYGDGRGGHLGVRDLGCCDGLVCIETKSALCLWNPSTRKSKRLPSVDLPHGHIVVYGFGYDSSIDDYKVVGFLYGHSGIDFEVKVYMLRTDSWRRIGDFPHGDLPYPHSSGVFVDGALHWNVSRETNGIIVSLDLAKETYGKILKPEYRDGRLYETLCAFNGCLCVLYDYRICAHLWVMKEYGIRDSWTKLAVVPYATRVSNLQYLDTMPFFIFKNGEVLLYTRKHLVRYNLKDGTFTYPTSPIDLASSILHPYIESLVSVGMDANKGVPCAPMVQY
ncbi:hypothetical protein RHMOL_Rhmol05G0232500 [Rhododendron molle]|uniref:Uncharacterized protein n=1 Tax=Rhododendron molle TaxID=49168 RepID=A0ACC0NT79_RHOML|nr:hypothetical protein RHMOL_Rhmol05G0232500 [Rhododendron molle]